MTWIGVLEKNLYFKNLTTEVDNVDYILKQNEELKETYKEIIEKDYDNISIYNTLREFSVHIKNTLEIPYSNGIMERNNSTWKLIKRIRFGFRNFKNFKARIMIMTNLFRNDKKDAKLSFSNP